MLLDSLLRSAIGSPASNGDGDEDDLKFVFVGGKGATEDKEVIFKYTTFDQKGIHISNYAVWRFIEDGKEADSVQSQII